MIKIYKKIQNIITPYEQKRFKILIMLMVFCAFVETLSIGALIPLINFFTNAGLMETISNSFLDSFGDSSLIKYDPINIILAFIGIIYLLKNFYLLFFNWIDTRFAFLIRTSIATRLFKTYLNKPYTFHINNNSSALITNIVEESKLFGNVMIYLSALITESLVIILLLIFLLYLKPLITIIVIILASFFGMAFYFFVKRKIVMGGDERKKLAKSSTKYLHQGLDAIKDLIFLNAQDNFIKLYADNITNLNKVMETQNFIQRIPKIWFELATITALLLTIFYLSTTLEGTGAILGIVAIFVITSIRIVPSIQKILVSIQYIKFSIPAINLLNEDLKIDKKTNQNENNKKVNFNNSIKYENILFKYPKENKIILNNINLEIKKNDFIGIIGKSGAGKSTLVDLMTGLLKANTGKIIIDDLNFEDNFYLIKNIMGYVSQNIFLTDETIKNNIAFGVDDKEIDNLKIEKAISTAQLTTFINNLEFGLNTIVGERGVKISGGERQRIGIARALYNDPKILVFDEATSALDLETEKDILNTLLKLKKDKTIIFITHRTSSLKYCNKIYELENGILTMKKN